MPTGRDRHERGEMNGRRGVVGMLTIFVAAALLSAAPAPDVLAGNSTGAALHGQGRVHGGLGAPLFNQAPPMPPVFNPATPYTAPATPEVPVSPASPGSVFGNGTADPQ